MRMIQNFITRQMERGRDLRRRYGRFVPLLLFGAGVVSVTLFPGDFEYVRWILVYLLTLWILTILSLTVLRTFKKIPARLEQPLRGGVAFLMQNLFEEVLVFLIPVYYVSTTPDSVNMLFFLALILAAISVNVDAIYRKIFLPRQSLVILLYGFSVFACLNFVIPVLLGIRNIYSLYISSGLSFLLMLPLYFRFGAFRHTLFLRSVAILVCIMWALVTWLRPLIPPAPLKLVAGRMTRNFDNAQLSPVNTFHEIPRAQLVNGIYCHTALFAPFGVQEAILHIWRHDGRVIDRISLADFSGGRSEGYRTRSMKKVFPDDPLGNWQVDAVTAGGQLIGRTRFTVVP